MGRDWLLKKGGVMTTLGSEDFALKGKAKFLVTKNSRDKGKRGTRFAS